MSISIERAIGVPATSLSTFLQSDCATASDFQRELDMGLTDFNFVSEYVNGLDQEQAAQRHLDAENVFQAGTPGVMSLRELEQNVDLGQWKLKLGQRLVSLEVSAVLY